MSIDTQTRGEVIVCGYERAILPTEPPNHRTTEPTEISRSDPTMAPYALLHTFLRRQALPKADDRL